MKFISWPRFQTSHPSHKSKLRKMIESQLILRLGAVGKIIVAVFSTLPRIQDVIIKK